MAEWTGLEPATPGVTGRYSNQLNYHSALKAVLLPIPGVPTGIRTPVTAVKGRCPRPLDDGDPDVFFRAFGGGTRDRTADLLHAMQALSQLSYTPAAKEGRIIGTSFDLVNRAFTIIAVFPQAAR